MRDAVATPFVAPDNATTQDPTLIGDVILKTRSMLRKRAGRPRSVISSTGFAMEASIATAQERRASRRWPASSAASAKVDAPPVSPPVKKYHGTCGFHTGGLITGRP